MRIDVSAALKNPGQAYPFSGRVVLAPMQVLDDPVSFEDVRVEGVCVGAGESASVEGKISASVHTRCARCLCPVEEPIEAAVHEIFTKEPDPQDPDQRPLDGHEIDLSDIVRDALLLELPLRFLCSADCKGLCPVCGVNMNNERCTCQEEGLTRPNPFSALSELLTEDEEV